MANVLDQLQLIGIVPVIAIDNADDAEPLAQALIDGGLPCAEVTFRTAAAKEAIKRMAKKFPSMLVGAGTVLTIDQVKTAVDAGVKFIVSPGLNPKVVEYCVVNKIPIIPGTATPSDVERAIELGLDVVKFFPAEGNGGLPYLKAISGPYNRMKFIPTGGIDETNILSYLRYDKIIACGGSWMVKQEMIAKKQFDEIKKLTACAVQLMLGFDIKHVGINNKNDVDAMSNATAISMLFNFPVKDGNSSVFAGTQVEFMKQPSLGAHGHIAIGTNFIDRAVAYFEREGVMTLPETKKEKNGKLIAVYLEKEIGGFAIHLLQNQ